MVYETTSSRVGVPEKKTFSLSRERERRNPAAWTMQQSAVTTTPAAAYPLRPIRYYLTSIPSIHHPTDRPTNNGLEMSKRKSARSDIIIIIHIAITQRTSARSPSCISTYLTFSPSDTRDLPDLTLPDLTLPHLTSPFWIPPKKKTFLTDPSIREDRSHRHQLTISKSVKYYSPKALVTTLH